MKKSKDENEKDKKITLRDVYYEEFWKCRDFELEHLWQRSVFLTAFLTTCFIGYGSFFCSVITAENPHISRLVANGIGFFISLVGLVLSVLWILMAKGSKAWYEYYENVIYAFPDAYQKAFEDGGKEISGERGYEIAGFKYPSFNDSISSMKAGRYSPSKINIAIGHLSLLIWTVLLLAHMFFAAAGCRIEPALKWVKTLLCNPHGMLVVVVFVVFGLWLYARMMLKSSFFRNC